MYRVINASAFSDPLPSCSIQPQAFLNVLVLQSFPYISYPGTSRSPHFAFSSLLGPIQLLYSLFGLPFSPILWAYLNPAITSNYIIEWFASTFSSNIIFKFVSPRYSCETQSNIHFLSNSWFPKTWIKIQQNKENSYQETDQITNIKARNDN